MRRYEGKTIEIEGFLSLGDRLTPTSVTTLAERCVRALHRSRTLCDPCITVPPSLPTLPK